MSSISERQRLMRERWMSQAGGGDSLGQSGLTRTKSTNDVLAAIEQEIKATKFSLTSTF